MLRPGFRRRGRQSGDEEAVCVAEGEEEEIFLIGMREKDE